MRVTEKTYLAAKKSLDRHQKLMSKSREQVERWEKGLKDFKPPQGYKLSAVNEKNGKISYETEEDEDVTKPLLKSK